MGMKEIQTALNDIFGQQATVLADCLGEAGILANGMVHRIESIGADGELSGQLRAVVEAIGLAETKIPQVQTAVCNLMEEWGLEPEITPGATRIDLDTQDLPPYEEDPDVDYSEAQTAHAVSTVLVHCPKGIITPDTEIMIVQRGSGDGIIGSWSGVSGYTIPDNSSDPALYTARKELTEECNLSGEELDGIELHKGKKFQEPRLKGGTINIRPLVGLCRGDDKPRVQVDGDEVVNTKWVKLGEIRSHPNLSPGFLTDTLPKALEGLGYSARTVKRMLGI